MANDWALILGASSGFGEATSLELARSGYNIFGVHLDLRATLPNAQRIQDEIASSGREAVFFNVNAADAGKRATVVEAVQERLRREGDDAYVRVFLHSLAFGSLLPYIGESPKDTLSQRQLEMTLDVMANSLVYWAQDLVGRNLLRKGSRIFAMTSSGATRVIKSYGASQPRRRRWSHTSGSSPSSWRRLASARTPSAPASLTRRRCGASRAGRSCTLARRRATPPAARPSRRTSRAP
jgi:NAD(P)-dependent dehydrogenase (short-subunit alcohol dehydrogenase family)